ncbi:MAG: hypothetical protein KVP17_000389 [Porospora cf. gigantea B]|uniref:uncharacterized protein n=3 Tax=Porospora cf. gigantea B TaxID=2853592 RepID=UPI003571DC9F|nr:MAG: hypothetical protein KVP17_000389 [Porospora cf. gigantea B]
MAVSICDLYVWGSAECDQLPISDESKVALKPFLCNDAFDKKGVILIGAGSQHSLAVLEDNSIVSWGNNDGCALGRECTSDTPSNVPFPVKFPTEGKDVAVVSVQAGDSHSTVLLADGSVWQWGSYRDSHGKTTFTCPTDMTAVPDVQRTPLKICLGLETKALKICAGANHTVCLAREVTGRRVVLSWGNNEFGQCNGVVTDPSDRTQQREDLTPCVTTADQLSPFAAEVLDVGVGSNCTFVKIATRSGDCRLLAFGNNSYGQLGVKKGVTGVVEVPLPVSPASVTSMGGCQRLSLLLTDAGDVLSAGFADIAGRDVASRTRLQSFERVDLPPMTFIGIGGESLYALSNQGELYAWGTQTKGVLGNGVDQSGTINLPRLVDPTLFPGKVRAIGAGAHHVLALVETKRSMPLTSVDVSETKPSRGISMAPEGFHYASGMRYRSFVPKQRHRTAPQSSSTPQIAAYEAAVAKEVAALSKKPDVKPRSDESLLNPLPSIRRSRLTRPSRQAGFEKVHSMEELEQEWAHDHKELMTLRADPMTNAKEIKHLQQKTARTQRTLNRMKGDKKRPADDIKRATKRRETSE